MIKLCETIPDWLFMKAGKLIVGLTSFSQKIRLGWKIIRIGLKRIRASVSRPGRDSGLIFTTLPSGMITVFPERYSRMFRLKSEIPRQMNGRLLFSLTVGRECPAALWIVLRDSSRDSVWQRRMSLMSCKLTHFWQQKIPKFNLQGNQYD